MLNDILTAVLRTAATLVCIFLVLLVVDLRRESAALSSATQSALASVEAIEVNTTRTEAEVAGLADATRHVALAEQKAFAQQAADVHGVAEQARQVLSAAAVAISREDSNAAEVLAGAADDEKKLAGLADTVTLSVAGITNQTTATLRAAAETVGGAQVRQSLDAVAATTHNAQTASVDLAATMSDARKAADYELKALTTPPSKLKWLAEEAVRLVGKFFGW